jgi:hypothetical protein
VYVSSKRFEETTYDQTYSLVFCPRDLIISFGSLVKGNCNLPKYHRSQLLVPDRGNLVVHRYVPLHGVRYQVSLSSSTENVYQEKEVNEKKEGVK